MDQRNQWIKFWIPMFGLISILYALVFFLNGIVILNERRFLNKVCLPLSPDHRGYLTPFQSKIVEFINVTRTVFEIPLLFVNAPFVIYELLLG